MPSIRRTVYGNQLDKWIADNGIVVGSIVRVTRAATDFENGWSCYWDPIMNQAINQLMAVSVIHPGYNITLTAVNSDISINGYFFPYFVLEPVTNAQVNRYGGD